MKDENKKSKAENELAQLIKEGDSRSFNGRLRRLMFLLSYEEKDAFQTSALAAEYYEEARLCWYVGAFVSTILMSQLAFEELLRSLYRVTKGVNGKLNCGKSVDNARFSELIDEAKMDGVISGEEADLLHNLRKNLRNPYAHVKDVKLNVHGKTNFKRTSFLTQHLKIVAPEVIGVDIKNEAKEAIKLLTTLFPKISHCFC